MRKQTDDPMPSGMPDMSTTTQVDQHHAAGVTTLTLDDGKANVMTLPMLHALDTALARAQSEAAAVVLTGRARTFSGGFDLAAFRRGGPDLVALLESGARLAARLLGYPRPVVVACNGHAVAMGALLLLVADHRLCASADLRIQLNEVHSGLTMPRFAIALCRQRLATPQQHAAVATSRPFGPNEAMTAGFFDELAEPDGLLQRARTVAGQLGALPAAAFERTKRRLAHPHLLSLDQAIADDVREWQAMVAAGT
mgnify:CR=1 FL=1